MFAEFALVAAVTLGFVSFLLSVVSLLVHYAKRAEHPLLGPIEAEIESMKLSQADIIDRIDHWQRRDRVRRLRAGPEEEPAPAAPVTPNELKAHLRALARGRQ